MYVYVQYVHVCVAQNLGDDTPAIKHVCIFFVIRGSRLDVRPCSRALFVFARVQGVFKLKLAF